MGMVKAICNVRTKEENKEGRTYSLEVEGGLSPTGHVRRAMLTPRNVVFVGGARQLPRLSSKEYVLDTEREYWDLNYYGR